MTQYKAVVMSTKCEKCGEKNKYLISNKKLSQYLMERGFESKNI
jgi:hypothetical protein